MKDQFEKSKKPGDLLEKFRLNAKGIAEQILKNTN